MVDIREKEIFVIFEEYSVQFCFNQRKQFAAYMQLGRYIYNHTGVVSCYFLNISLQTLPDNISLHIPSYYAVGPSVNF